LRFGKYGRCHDPRRTGVRGVQLGIDVGDVVFEDHDVLVFDSFIRAQVAEFGFSAVRVLAVSRSEDHHSYRYSYQSKQCKRSLHKLTSSELRNVVDLLGG